MTPIDFGGGMIFPASYGRDQFTPEQEAEMERLQLEDEMREEEDAYFDSLVPDSDIR